MNDAAISFLQTHTFRMPKTIRMRYPSPQHFSTTVLGLCLFVAASCAGNASNKNKTAAAQTAASPKPDIEGAWELVWSSADGQASERKKPTQLKVFSDGFFCLIMQDSTGRWNEAFGGTYETDGKTYKETHRYATLPEWVGATDWQEYEVRGDTLYKKLFTKVVNSKGEDITSRFPKLEEKRVRARK